jgi:hypothetical protein
MIDGATYDSALVSNLHVQATAVPNVHQLVTIVLDTTSSNYAIWRDLMMIALTRYSLADHVLSDDAFPNDPAWTDRHRRPMLAQQYAQPRSSGGCSAWPSHTTFGSPWRTSCSVIVRHVVFTLMLTSATTG